MTSLFWRSNDPFNFFCELTIELARGCHQLAGEGVERQAAEEVAPEATLHLIEAARGVFDPREVEHGVEALQFLADIGVAEEFGGAGAEEEKVFEEEREGAEKSGRFLLAL